MVDGQAGKGDTPRPIQNKEQYDRTYVEAFGEKCPKCRGTGCEVCFDELLKDWYKRHSKFHDDKTITKN